MCYWFTFFIKYMFFCFELNTGGRGEAVVTALTTPINLAWVQVLLCTPCMG